MEGFFLILTLIKTMKKIRIAINGFGRIGRITGRIIATRSDMELVAINDLTDPATLAHLYKYDSVHGRLDGQISSTEKEIVIDGNHVKVFAEKDPANLPWKDLDIDIVVESTGHFLDRDANMKHIQAGAKKVIISAPSKGSDIKAIVLGVNEHILDGSEIIISNASCTTNCAAPMIKILDDNWEVEDGYITTVHSYTGDQRLHDAPHKDLRRARAAALSIVPTSTGAAKAITRIFPHLEGKLGGCGMRVPVPDGSLTDITCVLKKPVTVEEINEGFRKAAEGEMKGILEYNTDPIVSVDIINNPHSCIFDPEFTSVVGNMVKVIGWYDNESGYSTRVVDLIRKIS